MANYALEYLPAGDSPSASMLATSPEVPILGIKRARATDGDDGPRQRPRHDAQMISTLGVSGNSRVLNVGGNYIAQMNDGLGAETHAVLESIEQRLKVGHNAVLNDKVKVWLSAPDVSQNFNAALRSRQPGTGTWFLDGAEFAEWKEKSNLVLCLYGAPGCGKTVLSSSIIEAVKASCATGLSGWAYFFFDGRSGNRSLRLYETFLRSVLSQLCSRSGGMPEAVKAIYRSHGDGSEQPCVKVLEETLREIISAFDDVYIIVDSVDESEDRIELVRWIQDMARCHSARWHILVTSRLEPDITNPLGRINNIRKIYLQGAGLDKDISMYLDARLSLTSRWSELIRALIKNTLMEGADGMFRWVALHMDGLEHCLNARAVREKLSVLPKDLETTYEQILTNSPHQHDLLHMLHWLAFSTRALRLEELAEVPSVDFDAEDGPCYDPDLKYSDPCIALTVCSGLITDTDGTVKLAHFSVKEYLISDHIKTGMAAHFAMNRRLTHSVIAQTCVAYLLIFNRSDSFELPGGTSGHFPLHLYAANNLPEHLRLMENTKCSALQKLLLKLFIPTPRYESALVNWVRMHNFGRIHHDGAEVAPPIYYASVLGLRDVVERLLEHGSDVDLQRGGYGTALQAAAAKAHTETAKLLLERGADVNLWGGEYGTALGVATETGHAEIVQLLLENGADVNMFCGTALRETAANGDTEIVQLLLDHGADVNVQGGDYGNALQAAASGGHAGTVSILLEHGADINIQGGRYGTALQAAASRGHAEIFKLLLQCGADVTHFGGQYAAALQQAMREGVIEMVQLLLKAGADVNIPGGLFENALRETAANGDTEIAKLLLEYGADVNTLGGMYGSALHAAASRGHAGTVNVLLEHGADVNLQGSNYGTALQKAAAYGYVEVVKLLLERGADANIQGGVYGTALQAAASGGHIDTYMLRVEHGSDDNMQGRRSENELREKAANGDTEIVKLLLEHGADVDIQGGYYETALQAAAANGYAQVVKLLLECGADANIQGGQDGTALQAAAFRGHTDIVKLLLERDADANIQGGRYGSALHATAYMGHTEIAKLLLEGGADINIQKVFHVMDTLVRRGHFAMTALQVTAARGHTETQQLLLQWSALH